MVGRRDQANRATVPPAHIACSQGWTLKRVRPGPKRWPWSGRAPSRPKRLDIKGPIQGLLRLHARYGPLDCSTAQGGLRGFDQAGCPARPLVSYQINRQLSGWNLPPLVIRAVGAHREMRDEAVREWEAKLTPALAEDRFCQGSRHYPWPMRARLGIGPASHEGGG